MKHKTKIGIIGQGFVGSAVNVGLQHAFDIVTYDKHKHELSTVTSLHDLCKSARIVFVCVPTPMRKDGSCDISIVENIVHEMDDIGYDNIVVIKSTVSPGTTERLNVACTRLACVLFNPEFLREASAIDDFKNQDRIIVGAPSKCHPQRSSALIDIAVDAVSVAYELAYPCVPRICLRSTEAELVKYITNCFLAMKVSFANEMYDICQKLDVDYQSVIDAATRDVRLGTSHWCVPGPMPASDHSGRLLRGFGGSCFCKDVNALHHVAKTLDVDATMLDATWRKNIIVRPEHDWELLVGRAVVDVA